MATWQQGINSGGFLAGIGAQNENAPKASDINATLGLIRENNDLARSGANNVALTGLRGLAGVADIYKQEQQQKALNAFNQVHANAWATGDPSGLFKFAQENPAFVAQAQQAFSGLNEQQRNDMGDLAMKANVALSQGPESYSKFITDNKDRLNRVGANPDWMIQTGVQNPEQLSHMLTTMSLGALGPKRRLLFRIRWLAVRLTEAGWLKQSAAIKQGKDFRLAGKILLCADKTCQPLQPAAVRIWQCKGQTPERYQESTGIGSFSLQMVEQSTLTENFTAQGLMHFTKALTITAIWFVSRQVLLQLLQRLQQAHRTTR